MLTDHEAPTEVLEPTLVWEPPASSDSIGSKPMRPWQLALIVFLVIAFSAGGPWMDIAVVLLAVGMGVLLVLFLIGLIMWLFKTPGDHKPPR